MNHLRMQITFAIALSTFALSCSRQFNDPTKEAQSASLPSTELVSGFSLGSDISWAKQMYATGHRWKNPDGVEEGLPTMFKKFSQSAISLRVWVNPSSDPSNGHCSPAEVADEAAIYYSAGYKISVCCHYGDTWNSVGNQTPPAAWAGYNYDQMKAAMVTHVLDVMNRLKAKGVTPTWFKNGNEINAGVVGSVGRVSNPVQMVGLLNACYDAAKSVFPNVKVIIHTGQPQNASANTFWQRFTANGGKFDVMGFSSYAQSTNIPGVFNAMKSLQASYAPTKPVIQVEYGGPWNRGYTATSLRTWIANINSLPNSSGGGVWYWEPECYNWNGYQSGAWDATTLMPSSGIMQAFNNN